MQETISIGDVRRKLGYNSPESMRPVWAETFDGEKMPDDDVQVPREKILTFLERYSNYQRGRKREITDQANELRRELMGMDPVLESIVQYSRQANQAGDHPLSEGYGRREDGFQRQFTEPKPERIEYKLVGNADAFSRRTTLCDDALTSPEISGTGQPTPEKQPRKFRFDRLDLVFYANVLFVDYGFIFLLKEMGIPLALGYSLIGIDALQNAKEPHLRETAKKGIRAIWVLEIIAGFVCYQMILRRSTAAVMNGEMSFDAVWVAIISAVFLSAATIYTVNITLSKTTEKTEAKRFEDKYNESY